MDILYVIAQNLIRLIACTWRLRVAGKISDEKAVIAFWHGEMLPVWKLFSHQNITAIVSLSKDGELLSTLLRKWKYTLIRGSSSKNGHEVLQKMVKIAKEGIIMLTPDGPRGPRMECKAGAIITAQRAQVPLYFLRCNIHNKKEFKRSWDRFQFPLPFTRIDISISKPIHVPLNINREEIDKLINSLNG